MESLNYQNITDEEWHCIHFNNIKKHVAARKHILLGDSKHKVKRGGHKSNKLRQIVHLFTGGRWVVIQFYSGSVCVSLIIYLQRKF